MITVAGLFGGSLGLSLCLLYILYKVRNLGHGCIRLLTQKGSMNVYTKIDKVLLLSIPFPLLSFPPPKPPKT